MKMILIFMIALTPTIAMAEQPDGPNNHYDCILESMKGNPSDKEAKSIRDTCQESFSDRDKIEYEDLPTSMLMLLEATAKVTDGNIAMTVYNNSNIWYIYELKIRVTDKRSGSYQDYSGHYPWCEPLSSCEFKFHVFEIPENMSWTILGGSGQHVP